MEVAASASDIPLTTLHIALVLDMAVIMSHILEIHIIGDMILSITITGILR
jgi:hypothetical protein